MSSNVSANLTTEQLENECPGLKFETISDAESAQVTRQEEDLLAVESKVCSYGDTVHYAERPNFFETCEGSFLYDGHKQPFLDLQMWYSAVNLGYANKRVNDALKKQIDK